MRYPTKKILPYATLQIILSLQIHTSLATETLTITEGVKQRFSKSILQVESGPGKPLNHETPTLPETAPSWTWQQSLKAVTGVPWLFATSLLEPFINDAPKVLGALKNEGKKLKEQGALSYTLVLGKHVSDTIKDNPLDAVIMTGAMALGWTNVAEYSTLVPLTVGVAGGVKNGKTIYEFAHSINGHTVIEKILQFGLYGFAIYAAVSLPVSYALSTPTLGTQFQINQNPLATTAPNSIAVLANGNIVGTWSDYNNNIVARIFYGNGTFVTNEFSVSSVATSSQVFPSVASLTGGDWIATWQGGTTNILSRVFSPTGTAITGPFTTNQITTYTSINTPDVAPFTNGNALVSWYASSSGNYLGNARIISSQGLALSNEFILCQSATVAGAPHLTSLTNGNVYAVLSCGGVFGAEVMPNATVVSNTTPINLSSNINALSVSGLSGGSAMAVFQSGNDNIFGRIIQNGVPTGNEFRVPNTTNIQLGGPSVTGLSTGNALAVWTNGNIEARLFDPTGTAQTNEFSLVNPIVDAQASPAVVGLKNGDGFVSWFGSGSNTLYGRSISFSTSPTPTPTPSGNPTPTPTGTPAPSPTTGIPTSTPSAMPIPTSGNPTPTPTGTPVPSLTTGMPTSAPVTSAGNALSPGFLFTPVRAVIGIVNSLATLLNWR